MPPAFLVDGNASLNNHLFLLEMNGTLRTAALFDYESNRSTYFIRIQARTTEMHPLKILFHFPINQVEDHDGDGIEDHLDVDDDNDGFPTSPRLLMDPTHSIKIRWPIPRPIRWSSANIIFRKLANWYDYRYFPRHGPDASPFPSLSSTNKIFGSFTLFAG